MNKAINNNYPKYKKELLNNIYDTLAGNTHYKQFKPNSIEECGISYSEGQEMYIYFNLHNGGNIKLVVSTEKGKYI